MKRVFSVIVSFLALSTIAGTAEAGSPNRKWGASDYWSIWYEPDSKGCFASTTYSPGTYVRLGFDMVSQMPYMMIGNVRTGFVEHGKEYRLRAYFDGDASEPWEGKAQGYVNEVADGTRLTALDMFVTTEFAVQWAKRLRLTLLYANTMIADLPLTGTYDALNQVVVCQRQANEFNTFESQRQTSPTPASPRAEYRM